MTDQAGPDPTAIRLERTFAAPAAELFAAWTSPDMLRRWYPPGAEWETPVAEVDLRIGGRLWIVMRSPDGQEFGGGGEYREIVPPRRLVFTWTWDRPNAELQLVEVDFSEHADGTTTVVLINRGLRDEASRTSHADGWDGSFDNLDRVLAR
jgi:uncharacterized protein YndB with AHSA1/START domain